MRCCIFSFQFGHYSCSPKGRSKTSLYWWNAQLCNHNTFYFLDYFFCSVVFLSAGILQPGGSRLRMKLLFSFYFSLPLPLFLPFFSPLSFCPHFFFFSLYAHSRCSQVDMTMKIFDRLLLLSSISSFSFLSLHLKEKKILHASDLSVSRALSANCVISALYKNAVLGKIFTGERWILTERTQCIFGKKIFFMLNSFKSLKWPQNVDQLCNSSKKNDTESREHERRSILFLSSLRKCCMKKWCLIQEIPVLY